MKTEKSYKSLLLADVPVNFNDLVYEQSYLF